VLVDLATILAGNSAGTGVAAFNVFGYEDTCAVVAAAEEVRAPVILAASLDFTRFMPLELIAGMFRTVGERAHVAVCTHLDHCYDVDEVCRAVDAGFTSVMYDGSQVPLSENIAATRRVVNYAHAAGVSVEGEIGSVPYAEGRNAIKAELTDSRAAAELERRTGLDALAVSVGNVHRLKAPAATIDFERLAEIEATTSVPLVIHGTSGIHDADLARLVRTRAAKFNIGTALRQSFGRGLRNALAADPSRFDRLEIMGETMAEMSREAIRQMRRLGWTEERPTGAASA
jgi:fructose-bisphosphate aldolase class II